MRNLITSLILMSILLVTACSSVEDPIDSDPSVAEPGFSKSPLEREMSPNISPEQMQALAQNNTAFALAFYDQIPTDDGNIIFSPFSLSLALSMTLAGAETSTEQAMLDALHMSIPESEVHPAFNVLLQAIENSQNEIVDDIEGSNFQLNIANSIWGQANLNFEHPFLNTLAMHYGAGLYTVDFVQDSESARNAINHWVEDETEDKIQNLIPEGAINPLTRLVLANAIYFNGSWLHPFRETATDQALFTTLQGDEITVDMMKLFDERLLYTKGDNYQAVSLPYLSPDFEMVIIVPDLGAFVEFEQWLTPEILINLRTGMQTERVDLSMPKFDFETTINANQILMDLGMAEAFDPEKSDFSGIADIDDLHITDVLHKATIMVDEKGTEAAAATAVIIGITSAPPDEPISLLIDRPFLFIIQHKPTGTILFMGRVTQP